MDPSAPVAVAQGVIATCATASLAAGIYGALRASAPPAGLLAASTALNSGIASATFFGLREYVVSPLLLNTVSGGQYARRRRALGLAPRAGDAEATHNAHLSWVDLRAHKVVDSAASGAVSGAVLNSMKRGRHGFFPGLTTGAIVCTLFQIAVNELDVARVRYLSRLQSARSSSASTPTPLSPFSPTAAEAEAPFDQPQVVIPVSEPKRPLSERMLDKLGLFGKISDEEYLEMMRKKRDGYLVRIEHLKRQIEAEKVEKEIQEEERRRTAT